MPMQKTRKNLTSREVGDKRLEKDPGSIPGDSTNPGLYGETLQITIRKGACAKRFAWAGGN